jgi:tetratricopeptide (TPR) repeat protein
LCSVVAAVLVVRVVLTAGQTPDNDWRLASEALYDDRSDEAERLARQALASRPLDGRAYAVLGRVALQRGELTRAQQFSALAVRRAPRHVGSLMLDGEMALERRDYMDAVARYDRLLRVFPSSATVTMPVLLQLAMDADGRSELLARMAATPAPPWRLEFLRHFAEGATDRAALADVFVPLADTGGLAPAEVDLFLGRYVREGEVAMGRELWSHLVPTDWRRTPMATPFNGDFEITQRVGGPFEWQIDPVPGVEVGLRMSPTGQGRALRVAFAGRRSAFRHVRQLLALPPGSYQLRWQSRFDELQTPQGLRWVLRCSGRAGASLPPAPLLATPARRGNQRWQREEAAFTVPAECPGQLLELELHARIPAETLARGSAWFDKLEIVAQP